MESDYIKNLYLLLTLLFLTISITSGSYAIQYNQCEIITGEGYTTGYGEGYYTHYSFYNYCPLCGATDSLERGVKRYDELTCTVCDADYSFSGKDKTYNPRAWLIPQPPRDVVPGDTQGHSPLFFPSHP